MDFSKYILKKKWWQSGSYEVINEQGEFVCKSEHRGFINRRFELLTPTGICFMRIESKSMVANSYQFVTEQGVIGAFAGTWSGNKFILTPLDKDPITIKINGWNNNIKFFKGEDSVGLASCNSYYNKIGCVIRNDINSLLILGSLILVGYLKTQSYS